MPCLVVFCFNGLREFPLQDVRLCDCFIAGTGAHASASMAWGAPLHTRRVSFVKSQVFKQQVFVTSMGRQGVAKKAKPATSPMGSMNSGQSPRRRRHQCHLCHRWHLWHQHVAPPAKHEAGLRDRDANHDGEPTSQVGGDDGEDDARIAHGFGDQPRSPHTSSQSW